MVQVREVLTFTAIGSSAAGLQLAIVAATVPIGLAPLSANCLGFLFAFVWSFVGHSRWTFPAQGRRIPLALRRFTVLSVLGFGLNEAFYAAALGWTALDYRLALFAVIASMGILKLIVSKHWAFATA